MNENRGWKNRRLIKTLSFFLIMAIVFTTVSMQWPGLAEAGSQTVYLDGINGNDEADGSSAEKAVRSFWKAKKLVGSEGSILISGTVSVTGDVKWSVPSGVNVKRAEGFGGALVEVNGTLTLEHISFAASDISGKGAVGEKKKADSVKEEAGKTSPEPTKETEKETDVSPEPTKEAEKETDVSPEPTKEAEKEADVSPEPTKEAEKETDVSPEPTKEAEKEADVSPEPTKEAEKEADVSPEPTKEAEKEADVSPEPTKEAEKEADVSPEPTNEAEKEADVSPEPTKEAEKAPITPEAIKDVEKPAVTEGLDKLQNLKVTIVSQDDVQAVIDAYRWYEGCTEEEKAMVPKELVIRLKKAQSASKLYNHTSNGISVSGNLPWYVQFKAEERSGDANVDMGDLLGSYEMTLWNLLEDAPYLLNGEVVTVRVPLENIRDYENLTVTHYLSDGSVEILTPDTNDGALVFTATSFSPYDISGELSSYIAGSQVIVGPTQDIYDKSGSTQNGAGSTSSSNSSSSGSSSSSDVVKPQISSGSSGSVSSQSKDRITVKGSVRTGDTNNLVPYIVVACAAAVLLILLILIGKRNQKK